MGPLDEMRFPLLLANEAKRAAKKYTDQKFNSIPKSINWKGFVNYYSDLPASPEVGDCYTVRYQGTSGTTPSGSEYAWGEDATTGTEQWVELGSGDGTSDHSQLSHRNDADQHTIGSITGLQAALNAKVDAVPGKGLSTNDYTSEDKTKLDGVETNADVTDADNVKTAGAVMGVKINGTEMTKDSDGKVSIPVAGSSAEGLVKADEKQSGDTQPVRIGPDNKLYTAAGGGSVTVVAPDYSEISFPVPQGKLCTHEGMLYRANQTISAAEAWTEAHWTATDVAEELKLLGQMSGITILTNPTKLSYINGEPFDPTGMVVKVDYPLPIIKTITSGYTYSPSGPLTINDTQITVSYTEGGVTATAVIPIVVTAGLIYGVCWNYAASSTALTRLTQANDPNGLVNTNITSDPVPSVGTGSGNSPFDDIMPWAGMDEYNIVDGVVTARKGEEGFSRAENDTMVYIPSYYYKIIDDAENSKRYFYIATGAETGFTMHPGSGRYVGRYNTISGYFSKTGSAPLVNITRSAARTGSRAKGAKWQEYDYASWCAVWLLYLVEFADWNSQTKIGRGIVDDSAAHAVGETDAMVYHTGRAEGTDGKISVQYRHIENPWGNVHEWIDGANFNERHAYICVDPQYYADNTTDHYTDTGITLGSSNGYIKSAGFSEDAEFAFLPTATGGSESTYIPDYLYASSGWRVVYVGGVWTGGSYRGLFYFNANDDSSGASAYIGARLLYIP